MRINVHTKDTVLGRASAHLLGNNIEAYEDTIPCMLSDRLRNPKFAGPENAQTGLAPEWEPDTYTMTGFACRLVPGMYLSGRESQLVHNYSQHGWAEVVQAGVRVRAGETFDVEMWARAQHRPVTVAVQLRPRGHRQDAACRGEMTFDQAHWQRRVCRITSPGDHADCCFLISVPGDSRLVIDQVHLRPADEGHVSRAFLDAFDTFPCPSLRFPGGCVSCTYHWEHGIGPAHLRPVCDDPVFRRKVHYDFGTDEYLALCAGRNIRPIITLNTSTATPDQAANWAAYIRRWYAERRLSIPAACFIVGNENYGAWEIGHMTGPMYVSQLRHFVPPLRAAYPEARIAALGEFGSGGLRDGDATPWRAALIEQAADLFDMLAVTRYSGGPDNVSLPESMACVADNVTDKTADLQAQARSLREAGLDRTIGIVEWNYWTRASHRDHAGFYEPNDIRHCLYAAGYLNAFCRAGEIVETANYYSLVNTMGMIHLHDGRLQLSDMVKVLNLYEDALPGDVLDASTDAPALTAKSRMLDANVVRAGRKVYAFLVNYSATDAVEATLDGVTSITATHGIRAEAILTPVSDFTPDILASRVNLPPMSLVRITATL